MVCLNLGQHSRAGPNHSHGRFYEQRLMLLQWQSWTLLTQVLIFTVFLMGISGLWRRLWVLVCGKPNRATWPLCLRAEALVELSLLLFPLKCRKKKNVETVLSSQFSYKHVISSGPSTGARKTPFCQNMLQLCGFSPTKWFSTFENPVKPFVFFSLEEMSFIIYFFKHWSSSILYLTWKQAGNKFNTFWLPYIIINVFLPKLN